MIDAVSGQWSLTHSLHREGDTVEERDFARRDAAIAGWLRGRDTGRLPQATATHGLRLAIAPDGRFTERRTGTPDAYWYDEDGVQFIPGQMAGIAPFDGRVIVRGGALYLRPDLPEQAMEVRLKREERYSGIALRIDDGDTLVADGVEAQGDRLVRTISVVTDEAYLSRLTLAYRRSVPD